MHLATFQVWLVVMLMVWIRPHGMDDGRAGEMIDKPQVNMSAEYP